MSPSRTQYKGYRWYHVFSLCNTINFVFIFFFFVSLQNHRNLCDRLSSLKLSTKNYNKYIQYIILNHIQISGFRGWQGSLSLCMSYSWTRYFNLTALFMQSGTDKALVNWKPNYCIKLVGVTWNGLASNEIYCWLHGVETQLSLTPRITHMHTGKVTGWAQDTCKLRGRKHTARHFWWHLVRTEYRLQI